MLHTCKMETCRRLERGRYRFQKSICQWPRKWRAVWCHTVIVWQHTDTYTHTQKHTHTLTVHKRLLQHSWELHAYPRHNPQQKHYMEARPWSPSRNFSPALIRKLVSVSTCVSDGLHISTLEASTWLNLLISVICFNHRDWTPLYQSVLNRG